VKKKRIYSIHLVASDKEKPLAVTISSGIARILFGGLALFLALMILTLILYLPRAFKYRQLQVENEELIRGRLQVMTILSEYNRIRQMDQYIRTSLGADLALGGLDSVALDSLSQILPSPISSGANVAKISYLDNIPIFPPVNGFVTQRYLDQVLQSSETHFGVDIAAKEGDPIKAAASGVVVSSGWTYRFGYTIILYHLNGYFTFYGHNLRNLVEPHQLVERGEVIGTVGNTGLSRGPHLHFEIWKNGQPINPQDLIFEYKQKDISLDKLGG
jgi:murein DD-endopeptidase MepM/ murein hydrolase activator NlpD